MEAQVMKKMMKATVCGLALVASLGLGMIAEAGSIPTGKVPLHTYAVRKVTCYVSPGGAVKGWIDPGDYVIVTQIRSDGWAYGSYPVKNGRTSRWFKANDLVNNVGFTNLERTSPQEKITVYRESSLRNSLGSVWGKEPITVVSNAGNNRQIIYKISGGYKMGWVPSRNILDPIQPVPPVPNNNVTSRMQSLSRSANGFKTNTRYTGAGECRGFANRVYTTLFNVSNITGYSSNNYAATSYSGSRVAGKLYNFGNKATSAVQNLFRNAKPGSFIQMGRRYTLNSKKNAPSPHSAILYSVSSGGCEFYEANTDWKNTIKINYYSWATLADKNKGFTIYEPNQYRLK
jgi:hypothetical protein